MLKILIAEDDLMIADMSEDILVEHGYEVCGIARTVAQADRKTYEITAEGKRELGEQAEVT